MGKHAHKSGTFQWTVERKPVALPLSELEKYNTWGGGCMLVSVMNLSPSSSSNQLCTLDQFNLQDLFYLSTK